MCYVKFSVTSVRWSTFGSFVFEPAATVFFSEKCRGEPEDVVGLQTDRLRWFPEVSMSCLHSKDKLSREGFPPFAPFEQVRRLFLDCLNN